MYQKTRVFGCKNQGFRYLENGGNPVFQTSFETGLPSLPAMLDCGPAQPTLVRHHLGHEGTKLLLVILQGYVLVFRSDVGHEFGVGPGRQFNRLWLFLGHFSGCQIVKKYPFIALLN